MDRPGIALFNLFVATGIIQALIFGCLLLFYPGRSRSKILFSLILFTLAGLSFKILLHTLDLWSLPVFRYFPLAIDTLMPPLLYAYVLAVTGKAKRITLYFIPALVFVLYGLLIYLLTLQRSGNAAKDALAETWHFNQVKIVEDSVALMLSALYWYRGYREIAAYRRWQDQSQSDTGFQEYRWLKNLLILTGILIAALGLVFLLEDLLNAGRHDFIVLQCFYCYLAVLSYYLSLTGYRIYTLPVTVPAVNSIETLPAVKLTPEDQQQIQHLIGEALGTEKLYLNPELSLKDLSVYIGHPPAQVSAVINQGFGQNFRNLVNSYRVSEVKERLKDPPAHLSLLGIALDCGFNSEASFYRIFRQETGRSPGDYLKTRK